jgi:hypothetical protein
VSAKWSKGEDKFVIKVVRKIIIKVKWVQSGCKEVVKFLSNGCKMVENGPVSTSQAGLLAGLLAGLSNTIFI